MALKKLFFALFFFVTVLLYGQESSFRLSEVNGWSYQDSYGIPDLANIGMKIDEGPSPFDSVQTFLSSGWTTRNTNNQWRQTNSFGKFKLSEEYQWPDKVSIEVNILTENNVNSIIMAISMFDTTNSGLIGTLYMNVPVKFGWQKVEFEWVGPRGNFVHMLGVDFTAYSTDSSKVGIVIQANNLEFEKYVEGIRIVDSFGDAEVTSVEPTGLIPSGFVLEQNYPNPFNPTTTIRFSVPNTEFVNLKIYDVLGREVETLVNEEKTAGSYEVSFDASSLPSGSYYYRLKTGDFVQTKKMILIK